MKEWVIRIAVVVAVAIAAGLGGAFYGMERVSAERPTITCPTEDSCQIDYRNGAWWVQQGDDAAITHEWIPASDWVRVTD